MLHHQVLKMTKRVTVYTKLTIQLNTTDCLGPRSASIASGCDLFLNVLPHKAKPSAAESRPWLPYQKKTQNWSVSYLFVWIYPTPQIYSNLHILNFYSREDWKRSSQCLSPFTTATTSYTSIKKEIKFHLSFLFKLFLPVHH